MPPTKAKKTSSAKGTRRTRKGTLYDVSLDELRWRLISYAIEDANGNKSEASRRLGVSYATIKTLEKRPKRIVEDDWLDVALSQMLIDRSKGSRGKRR